MAERNPDAVKNLAIAVYVLQGVAFLIGGFTAVIGVVINYIKLDDARGTWLESHFRWQLATFWWGLVWMVIGLVTTVLLVGWLILLATVVWIIYRIAKGALALNDGVPVA
ncbi:MAG: hypothetical protein LAT63_02315 [Marinobacter sp.]|nr:hypothetical protein [Marinobacter sp.]